MDLIEVIANDNSESCSFSVKPQKLKQYSRKSRNSFSPLVSDDWEIDEDNLVNEVLREDRKVVVEKIIQANDLDEESQTLGRLTINLNKVAYLYAPSKHYLCTHSCRHSYFNTQ